jgi:predicted DsbA family dithiol-disulfide isomerase
MKVEIWSDVMCPFCYIGKHRFEKALEKFPQKDKIEVEWKSFQLDPNLTGIVSKEAYFAKKGYPATQLEAMNQNMRKMAAAEGLEMNMDKIVFSNTEKAHLLLQFAKNHNKGMEAEEVLFHMYFTEGLDMNQDATIATAINRLSLSQADFDKAAAEGTLKTALEKDLQEAQYFGITGVPFFIFDRKYAVSGAQSEQHFLQALGQAYAESAANVGLNSAEGATGACTIDGNCN